MTTKKTKPKKTPNLLFNPIPDDHAPVKKIKLWSWPNPCITDEIRSLIRPKDYWRKIARKSNDPLDWAAYKNFKREVKRELRLTERENVENQIRNNPNNPRCVWKMIRSRIPRKSEKKKSFSDSDDTVAKEFNEFFNSIGQNSWKNLLVGKWMQLQPHTIIFCAKVLSPFTTIFI